VRGWCEDCLFYEQDLSTYESAKNGLHCAEGTCTFGRILGWPKWLERKVGPKEYRDCVAFCPRGSEKSETLDH